VIPSPSPSPLFILVFVCINTVISHGVRLASISTPQSPLLSTAYVAPPQVPTRTFHILPSSNIRDPFRHACH
jgi:hypothetical protein